MAETLTCRCGRPATEMHHCLVHRMRNKPALNHPYNLEPVCHACHQSGVVNGYEYRRRFYREQIGRYGDNFRSWWHELPLKAKPNYD